MHNDIKKWLGDRPVRSTIIKNMGNQNVEEVTLREQATPISKRHGYGF